MIGPQARNWTTSSSPCPTVHATVGHRDGCPANAGFSTYQRCWSTPTRSANSASGWLRRIERCSHATLPVAAYCAGGPRGTRAILNPRSADRRVSSMTWCVYGQAVTFQADRGASHLGSGPRSSPGLCHQQWALPDADKQCRWAVPAMSRGGPRSAHEREAVTTFLRQRT